MVENSPETIRFWVSSFLTVKVRDRFQRGVMSDYHLIHLNETHMVGSATSKSCACCSSRVTRNVDGPYSFPDTRRHDEGTSDKEHAKKA
jgi:hypothetical protein